ncbi:hypothetical protein KVF89_25990 [Nocardioides carbamazepini]|uniref:DUF7716 domain-containing protein n=1 Tax=Nocardioides carbamazepini TaxID=2854259 RepID=UPI002149D6A7|nr:hypothetical protein [Nocardioides carbamazepini]MCR1786012.1 hypothetical protein [Nocardioides carbamazepini]
MLESIWDDVILGAEELAFDAYVCFASLPATGAEPVVITTEDDWEVDDDEVPTPASQVGMTACIVGSDLVQIVANARAQVPGVAVEALRRSVRYYYENDAFLSLDPNA